MRIFLYSILLLMLWVFIPSARAEIIPHTVYAISHNNILKDNLCSGNVLTFTALDNYEISETEYIEENAIIKVKIKEHIRPKRGKRNGYLKIQVISYTVPSKDNKEIHAENRNIYGTLRLSTTKDLKDISKKTGIAITGHILKIPGFSQAIAVSKGLISPNEEQNRLQSAGTNLYKSTPLVYAEKGKDISIEEDSIVIIRVKNNTTAI